MKFTKLLWFDLKEGIIKCRLYWTCSILIGFTLFVNFMLKVRVYEKSEIIEKKNVSFADFFMYAYGGVKKYIPLSGEKFIVPIIWLIIFVAIPFLLVNYPLKDLLGVGQQVVVRANGRKTWWISKCIWNIIATLLYHGIIILIALSMCKLMNCNYTTNVNWDFQNFIYEILPEDSYLQCSKITISLCIIPIMVSMTINMFQMTISLYIKPMFSFVVTVIVMCFSAYYCSSYMIGDYVMLLRFDKVCPNGVSIGAGYIIMIVVLIISIIVGMLRFYNYDILNQD